MVTLTIAVRSETVVPHKVAMFSINTGFPWNTERSMTSPFRRAAWKLWRVLPADMEEKRRLEVATTLEESINKITNKGLIVMEDSGVIYYCTL
jgi:hypothetical protein